MEFHSYVVPLVSLYFT